MKRNLILLAAALAFTGVMALMLGATLDVPATYLNVETPYDDNMVVHPSVIDFGAGNTWNGYRFWMAETPYDFDDTTRENPCIHVSADGVTWIEPPGISNPIAATPASGSNSDTELVWEPSYGRLECYWRNYNAGGHCYIKRLVSTDGVTWSNEETVIDYTTAASGFLSPTIVNYGDGLRQMWMCHGTPGSTDLKTLISTDYGTTWGDPNGMDVTGDTSPVYPYHIAVTRVPRTGELYMLALRYRNPYVWDGYDLWLGHSLDGWNWAWQSTPVVATVRQTFAMLDYSDLGGGSVQVNAAEASVFDEANSPGGYINFYVDSGVASDAISMPIVSWVDANSVVVTDSGNEIPSVTDPNCSYFKNVWYNAGFYRGCLTYDDTTDELTVWSTGRKIESANTTHMFSASIPLHTLRRDQTTNWGATPSYIHVTTTGSAAYSACSDPNQPAAIATVFNGTATSPEAGDTVFIQAGTYELDVPIPTTNAGTIFAPIEVVGVDDTWREPNFGTYPVVLANVTDPNRCVQMTSGDNYWEWRNIEFKSTTAKDDYVVWAPALGMRMVNCYMHSAGKSGVYRNASIGPAAFQGCVFEDVGAAGTYAALRLNGVTSLLVDSCTFSDCNAPAIQLDSATVGPANVSNCIFNSTAGGIVMSGYDPNNAFTVRNCVFYDSDYALHSTISSASYTPTVVFENCIFYDTTSTYWFDAHATGKARVVLVGCAFGISVGPRADTNTNVLEITPSTVLTADPFQDAANGDFRLNAYGRLALAGWPGVLLSQDTNERPGPYQNSHDVTLQPWPGSRIW